MSTDRDSMIVLPRRRRPMGRALGVIPSLMIVAALLAAWQVYSRGATPQGTCGMVDPLRRAKAAGVSC